MSTPIALSVPGLDAEPQLIAGAADHGIEVSRRCVDAADLLGACLGAPGLAAVITAGLPRLSADVVARLRAADSRVIAIAVRPDDRAGLESLGIDTILEPGDARELLPRLAQALRSEEANRGVWNLARAMPESDAVAATGRVIVVWGPAGAPGRTTTALVLAQALARSSRTVIVDADTSAPSLALHLCLADDLSGLTLACRHAENGALTRRSLESTMSRISEFLYALTGIIHACRASEVRPSAFSRVLDRVRSEFAHAVIDIGANLELPSAVTALGAADVVVAVCRAEPLGVARFLADLPSLAEHGVPIVCVITEGGQAKEAERLIHDAAHDLGISIPVSELTLNRDSLSDAMRRGPSMRSMRRSSRKSAGVNRLVELVA